jgi:hypothetical protein
MSGRSARRLGEQRFDELVEVVDLLELAPAVLVELAVAGQDVQLLEQLDRLAGADFGVAVAQCGADGPAAAAAWPIGAAAASGSNGRRQQVG